MPVVGGGRATAARTLAAAGIGALELHAVSEPPRLDYGITELASNCVIQRLFNAIFSPIAAELLRLEPA
jgi:hypothetical protein